MQTLKCLFVLAAIVLVVCVSASDEKKKEEDTRPLCFKERNEEEQKKWRGEWDECKKKFPKEDEKNRTVRFMKKLGCILEKKNLIKDGKVDIDAMLKRFDERVNPDHLQAMKDVVEKCKTDLEWSGFFCCFRNEKKNLPCKCHKKCKKGDEKKDEEEAAAAGDVTAN